LNGTKNYTGSSLSRSSELSARLFKDRDRLNIHQSVSSIQFRKTT